MFTLHVPRVCTVYVILYVASIASLCSFAVTSSLCPLLSAQEEGDIVEVIIHTTFASHSVACPDGAFLLTSVVERETLSYCQYRSLSSLYFSFWNHFNSASVFHAYIVHQIPILISLHIVIHHQNDLYSTNVYINDNWNNNGFLKS